MVLGWSKLVHRRRHPDSREIQIPLRRNRSSLNCRREFLLRCVQSGIETTDEIAWNDLRLVVAHDPVVALEHHQKLPGKDGLVGEHANGSFNTGSCSRACRSADPGGIQQLRNTLAERTGAAAPSAACGTVSPLCRVRGDA